MLSVILRSNVAIRVSIRIMDIFVDIRKFSTCYRFISNVSILRS